MRRRFGSKAWCGILLGVVLPTSLVGCKTSSQSSPEDVRRGEAALRRHIADTQSPQPTYGGLDKRFADRVRSMARARELVVGFGAVREITYKGPGKRGANRYEVTSENGHSEWMVSLSPSGEITGLMFLPIEKPPVVPPSEQQLVAGLRTKLEKFSAADSFAGAVIVAHAGKSIFEAAYGMADRQRKTPNQLDTKFCIGSMNKMFTAVAVLQLVEAGKLGLDDLVGKHLAGYPNADIAGKVTIRHLLTHTGGTGDIFGPRYEERRQRLRTLEDYVELYGTRGLAYEPGSRFEYSSYGYVLLGLIVAKVSGQNYFDYVREKIFHRAGMMATASEPEGVAVAGRSVGYMDGPQGWRPNTDTLPPRATSAGGGYSTAGDLVKFANAVLEHRLLSEKSTSLLTTGTVKARDGKWALGLFDHVEGGVRWFGHGGGGPGMNGDLRIFPTPGYVVVVLANLDPPSASMIGDFVAVRVPK